MWGNHFNLVLEGGWGIGIESRGFNVIWKEFWDVNLLKEALNLENEMHPV